MTNFSEFYMNSNFSDITITIKDEKIPCHKIILYNVEYFKTMLLAGMKESVENDIKIEDIYPKNFKLILKYIYSSSTNLTFELDDDVKSLQIDKKMYTTDDYKSIINMSHLMGLDDLCIQVSKLSIPIMKIRNLPSFFNFLHIRNLDVKCKKYFIDRFCTILKSWIDLYETVDILDRKTLVLKDKKNDSFYNSIIFNNDKLMKRVALNFKEYIAHTHFNNISCNLKRKLLHLYSLKFYKNNNVIYDRL